MTTTSKQYVLILFAIAFGTGAVLAQGTQRNPPRSANDRMLDPGPEAARLAARVGTWDVIMTLCPDPEGTSIVVKGLVAERAMIGLYLQEIMRPAQGSDVADFRRIEYLTYNPIEARWQYVSMDTRVPIGLMTATSVGREPGASIEVHFENLAFPVSVLSWRADSIARDTSVDQRQSSRRS